MSDLMTAAGLLALAELGDKSQLLALAFATRHRWWQVLLGVAVAAALVLGLASTLGGVLGAALPERGLLAGAGLLFLAFAWWTWREGEDDGAAPAARVGRSVTATIVLAFVVAELGDKSMLAAAALAATRSAPWVWGGAVLGMTAASGVAIVVGRALGRRVPADRLRQLSALAFAVFGVLSLAQAAWG